MQDILNQISQLHHTFIAGSIGTGKDLLASFGVKALKQQQPSLTVYVIDLKADCKENYYDNCADIVRRRNFTRMISETSLTDLFNWVKGCFLEFAQITGKKLLIITEATFLFHKFNQDKDYKNWLTDQVITYLCIGHSAGAYLWLIGQNLNLESKGIGFSSLSIMKFVLIVSADNLANYDYICRTSFIPEKSRISAQKIKAIAQSSAVNRAVYSDGHWSPMPMLTHV